MSSQIYARYVPPSKTKSAPILPSASVLPIPASLESSSSTPPVTRQDASSTYARYIPSSKKKPVAIRLPENHESDLPSPSPSSKRKHATLDDHNDEVVQSKEKQKKQKKSHMDDAEPISTAQPDPKQATTLIPASEYYGEEEIHQDLNASKGKGKAKKRRKNRLSLEDTETLRSEIAEGGEAKEGNDEDEDTRHKRLLRKRERSMKKAKKLALKDGGDVNSTTETAVEEPPLLEEEELHDLVPLPQPDPVPELSASSITASLPPWLASPIRAPPTSTSSFKDLGLSEEISVALHDKGFSNALPIQTALLPLLLPGAPQQPGDVLVSAATGSGKTLAYVLPMMENISRSRHLGIQGLVVVPTRELVAQARHVCEVAASVFSKVDGYTHRPVIGTAVGNETLQAEQEALMGEELSFDPAGYDAEMKAANAPWESSDQPFTEGELFPQQEFKPRIPGHVIKPFVKADILICTPGRLVEHLKSTPAFSLRFVRWLIVDEADKLLDQTFQQWLDIVMGQVHSNKRNTRDHVRKIILSATMTSDIGQLTSLKLYRPKLVVLEGCSSDDTDSAHQLAIPALLKESGVKIEDDIIKPLYLIELLKRVNLIPDMLEDNTSSSDSESSDSESDSDSSSDSESDSDSESSLDSVSSARSSKPLVKHTSNDSSVLIFTKSNETAVRLSRLIALLCPTISSRIGTLTSTTPRQSRQRTISSFSSGKTTILVASDLVSRGLDLPDLAHVINYDVPTSLTSYVHRIGRTARAGKEGHAWTLFTVSEAGWFWREIARNEKVQRVDGAKVERVNIKKEMFDGERQKYDDALEELEKEASSKTSKRD